MARAARRLIRIVAAALAALLLLVLLGAAAIVLFVDADRFRPRIERAAGDALGRPVSLGRLHWNLGRRVALRTEGGSVANLPGFDAPALAAWRSVDFGLALWPLLSRREAHVDHLQVDGLALDLQRLPDGRVNWEFGGGDAGTEAGDAQGDAPAGDDQREAASRLSLDSLALRNASVRYRDGSSGRDLALGAIDLSLQLPEDLGAPELRFANLRLDATLQQWPLRLRADAVGIAREGLAIDIPAFEAGFDEASASGQLSARLAGSPSAQARLSLAVPSLRRQLQRIGRPLSPMQDADVPGPLGLEARLQLDGDALRIDELVLEVDDTTLTGWIELPQLDPPALRFDLAADVLDVDRYLSAPDAPSEPYELPVRQLRSIDAKGTLRIEQLQASGATARQSVITVE